VLVLHQGVAGGDRQRDRPLDDLQGRQRVSSSSIVIGSDPLTDVLAAVLTVPLRELYAVLWRVGVVEVDD
jgi:hypothetical protein